MGEIVLKLTSEAMLKRGQLLLLLEQSILTGLIWKGPKMPSINSKTFRQRVWKVEYGRCLRLESKSIRFGIFTTRFLLC